MIRVKELKEISSDLGDFILLNGLKSLIPTDKVATSPENIMLRDLNLNEKTTPERPTIQASHLKLEEFLVKDELDVLIRHTVNSKGKFQRTKVLKKEDQKGVVDANHRRSMVLYDTGQIGEVVKARVLTFLPWIFEQLGITPFPVEKIELQLTRTGNSDFFRIHNDNTSEPLRSRVITFVYYFFREPKPFFGGDLRLYDYMRVGNQLYLLPSFNVITPKSNQMIVFPSGIPHEVLPVFDGSNRFQNGRFTLNGWIHKKI